MATERDALKAMELHEKELMALPNVVGIGVRPVGKSSPTDYQVAVYVSKKVPDRDLKRNEIVPEALEVRRGGGTIAVPTKVIESGEFVFE